MYRTLTKLQFKTNTALLKELMDKLQMIFELKDQISAF